MATPLKNARPPRRVHVRFVPPPSGTPTLAGGEPDASPPLPAAGARLGRYQLEALLGQGGAGQVWRAYDLERGRAVALKLLVAGDQQAQARFAREARAVAALSHPAIVPLLDAGQADRHLFLVLELVEGEPLSARIKRAPLSAEEATRTTLEIACAVAHAHREGVLHRDLKPHNVLVDRAGQPRLIDFGLARGRRIGGALTRAGDVLGTPAYMSPEQANGEPVDVRTDVYGLGALLYALLTGHPPHEGRGAEALYSVLGRDPRPPRAWRPEVPLDLEAICLRALSRDPARRYPSAERLAQDLACVLRGQPLTTATPPSAWWQRWM